MKQPTLDMMTQTMDLEDDDCDEAPHVVFHAIGPLGAVTEDPGTFPWFVGDTSAYAPAVFVLWREGQA